MAAANTDAGTEAIKAWYKRLLDEVVKEMVRIKAVTGNGIRATPVWMVPHDTLIAKVWGVGNENDFVWTISVDKFIADYIAGSLASTPRDVARHFALKWQLDADRMLGLPLGKASAGNAEKLKANSQQLVERAEILYDLCQRDDAWRQLPDLNS